MPRRPGRQLKHRQPCLQQTAVPATTSSVTATTVTKWIKATCPISLGSWRHLRQPRGLTIERSVCFLRIYYRTPISFCISIIEQAMPFLLWWPRCNLYNLYITPTWWLRCYNILTKVKLWLKCTFMRYKGLVLNAYTVKKQNTTKSYTASLFLFEENPLLLTSWTLLLLVKSMSSRPILPDHRRSKHLTVGGGHTLWRMRCKLSITWAC